jgi:hypothetical protein
MLSSRSAVRERYTLQSLNAGSCATAVHLSAITRLDFKCGLSALSLLVYVRQLFFCNGCFHGLLPPANFLLDPSRTFCPKLVTPPGYSMLILRPYAHSPHVFSLQLKKGVFFREYLQTHRKSWSTAGGAVTNFLNSVRCSWVFASCMYHWRRSERRSVSGISPTISGAYVNSFWITRAVATERFKLSAKPCIGWEENEG